MINLYLIWKKYFWVLIIFGFCASFFFRTEVFNILRKHQNTFLFNYYSLHSNIERRIYSENQLKCLIIYPTTTDPKKPLSTIVFFYGGGFYKGSIGQFFKMARAFSDKGYLSIIPDYRVKLRHGTSMHESIEDVFILSDFLIKSELNIDKERVTFAGASAGGLLALSTSIFDQAEYFEISDSVLKPVNIVLFSPIVDISPSGYVVPEIGTLYGKYSPMERIKDGIPPCIIFHGRQDPVMRANKVVDFCSKMNLYNNKCELNMFDSVGHNFFQFDKYEGKYFKKTFSLAYDFIQNNY